MVILIIIFIITRTVTIAVAGTIHSECWNAAQSNVTCSAPETRGRRRRATSDGSRWQRTSASREMTSNLGWGKPNTSVFIVHRESRGW